MHDIFFLENKTVNNPRPRSFLVLTFYLGSLASAIDGPSGCLITGACCLLLCSFIRAFCHHEVSCVRNLDLAVRVSGGEPTLLLISINQEREAGR